MPDVVKIEKIELQTPDGPVLWVSGADLMNGTPILDIKPYLPFADSHPEASGGYTDQTKEYGLQVKISEEILSMVSEEKRDALKAVLAHDPRPSYQNDPERIYGMEFAGYEVKR